MAKGDPIPDGDHVTRLCGRGYDSGEITSAAFEPRPGDKGKLSVDWVECAYDSPARPNIEGSLARLTAITTDMNQPVGVLEAQAIRRIRRNGCQLDVIEHGSRRTLCHSVITGMTGGPIDLGLEQDLAELANAGDIRFLT